jgi:hypothetical protein
MLKLTFNFKSGATHDYWQEVRACKTTVNTILWHTSAFRTKMSASHDSWITRSYFVSHEILIYIDREWSYCNMYLLGSSEDHSQRFSHPPWWTEFVWNAQLDVFGLCRHSSSKFRTRDTSFSFNTTKYSYRYLLISVPRKTDTDASGGKITVGTQLTPTTDKQTKFIVLLAWRTQSGFTYGLTCKGEIEKCQIYLSLSSYVRRWLMMRCSSSHNQSHHIKKKN